MTTQEFSDGFDVLYNNVMSNQAPGLDEYEKSFFLTKAQDEILKNYFNPKGNKYQEGIDGSPKRQIDFSMVLKVNKAVMITDDSVQYNKLDNDSVIYELPSDIFIILNERLKLNNRPILVIPINHTEYDKYSMKPYPYPTKNTVWRILGYGTKDGERVFVGEIIKSLDKTLNSSDSYTVRYVKQPDPIILGNIKPASINDKSDVTECELDPILHQEILQRAVELAKAAYVGDLNSTIEMGKRSE